MSRKETTITPIPLFEEDPAYANLLSTNHASPIWDIETEGELAVDVIETPSDIIVRSAIAGVRPEDLSIHVTEDTLTIRGSREACNTIPFAQMHIEECHWGQFSRTIILPTRVRADDAVATMKHGILSISLSKATHPEGNVPVFTID